MASLTPLNSNNPNALDVDIYTIQFSILDWTIIWVRNLCCHSLCIFSCLWCSCCLHAGVAVIVVVVVIVARWRDCIPQGHSALLQMPLQIFPCCQNIRFRICQTKVSITLGLNCFSIWTIQPKSRKEWNRYQWPENRRTMPHIKGYNLEAKYCSLS